MTNKASDAIDWSHLRMTPVEEIIDHPWSRMSWECWSKYIPPDAKLLEIGCGTGRIITQSCKHRQAWGIGLDIDSAGLSYARELSQHLDGDNCHFVQGDGFVSPVLDNTFDVVVSEGVIEHFPPLKIEAMVREHVRACKVGGRVIISVPNTLNLPLTYARWRMGKEYPAYPEHGFTIWELARLLRRCGVRPIAYDGYAAMLSLEWYIHESLRFRFIDRLISKSGMLSSVLGYMCLVVGIKENAA